MPRTAEEVRAEFRRKGISIAEWALAHGFTTNLVFEVLAGRKKCLRGKSHQIAVMLGLKDGELAQPKDIDYRARPARRRKTAKGDEA